MPESMTTTAAEPSATDVYALGRDPGESARLQRQSEELRSDSTALLDRVGLGPGQSAIDLGCGPSGIIELLAERVSPGGRVVGLDADPAHVAMARELARQRGLGNVDIVAAHARRTGLPAGQAGQSLRQAWRHRAARHDQPRRGDHPCSADRQGQAIHRN